MKTGFSPSMRRHPRANLTPLTCVRHLLSLTTGRIRRKLPRGNQFPHQRAGTVGSCISSYFFCWLKWTCLFPSPTLISSCFDFLSPRAPPRAARITQRFILPPPPCIGGPKKESVLHDPLFRVVPVPPTNLLVKPKAVANIMSPQTISPDWPAHHPSHNPRFFLRLYSLAGPLLFYFRNSLLS